VIRDRSLLCSESVSIRELHQLLIGNCLLGFALEAMEEIAAAQAVGILEHPAEPDASIWRLALMDVILQLPGASRIRFAQGLMGAPTPKPTDLLIINMNHMLLQLHQHRVCSELPRSRAVGCDALGHWRTTILKEYPPSLCLAFANAFSSGIKECPVCLDVQDPPQSFIDTCHTMHCTDFGEAMGHDFAGRR
jgi:hypothetical protein